MNIWDFIIIGILAGIVVLAIFLVRRRKKTGCCGSCGDYCHCESTGPCSACGKCKEKKHA